MRIVLVAEAAQEFEDAVAWYEEQQSGLGRRLRDEIDLHLRWISVNPDMPRLRPGGYRRVNLRVFPYYLAYIVHNAQIWVLPVAHTYRKPEYWIGRRS
jgi:plasmid stabilization system protein ParE